MASDRVHLSVEEARALGEGALRGVGYDSEEAWIVADHVIDAALCGYEYSGLAKILNIPEHRRFSQPRRPMRLLHETEVSALYDGGNNVGMVAMYRAAKAAIAKAEAHGISIVGVTDSWMSGRNAYFVEMIARAGLVAIHTASSGAVVAPYGGTKPVLGTNPIAFAIPGAAGPLVLDMGTSAFMATELQLRVRLAQPLPDGVAIDTEGQPTNDPDEARRGALLPFGAHKGFGLGLIVQAFGLLGGAALSPGTEDGYVFIAFRPDLLVPMADLKRELGSLIDRVKAVPPQPGVSEIRIPGEQSARNRERLSREGLDIDRLVYDRLTELAGRNAPPA
ncbi:MAG TPA: Ldh family oxidoreductase [Stellaceae bacterium]|jgi:LDH2 family malate/lactate/ureidoglycolate dehydrogenase|nr:Ldh family oxidoreductase [Stellaceae bacterium]